MNEKSLENTKPIKSEYSDILGKVGDFKTKEGYSYSKLIYAKITELEELSRGGAFGKINTVQVEIENGNIEIFAEKVNNKNEGGFNPVQILEKYRRLKEIGAKTFDNMFIAKNGKVIISTLLNKDKRVALSANNALSSSSFSQNENINYKEVFNKNLKIKNLEEILESLPKQAILASQAGLQLAEDCLFFLVPKDHNNEPVDIDFLIGDLDLVKINDLRKNDLALLSLNNIIKNIDDFIQRYAERYADSKLEYLWEYLKLVQEKLNPELKKNQIFTKNGIKNLIDYTEEDGEVLKSNLENPDENTSWKEIEKLSQISSTTIDLTNIKVEFKKKITSWKGSLADGSSKFNYPALQIVGGNLNTWNAKNFSANALQIVKGDLSVQSAENFSANALQTIEGYLDTGTTKNFLAKNLTKVQNIYLTKLNFSEYWQNNIFDWDKAYKNNKLVLKEELRDKVVWTKPIYIKNRN